MNAGGDGIIQHDELIGFFKDLVASCVNPEEANDAHPQEPWKHAKTEDANVMDEAPPAKSPSSPATAVSSTRNARYSRSTLLGLRDSSECGSSGNSVFPLWLQPAHVLETTVKNDFVHGSMGDSDPDVFSSSSPPACTSSRAEEFDMTLGDEQEEELNDDENVLIRNDEVAGSARDIASANVMDEAPVWAKALMMKAKALMMKMEGVEMTVEISSPG